MKRLIDAIIKKWFCCHEWEYLFERRVEVVDDWGDRSWYTVRHISARSVVNIRKLKVIDYETDSRRSSKGSNS